MSHICHIWIKPGLASQGQKSQNQTYETIANASGDLTVVYLVEYILK